MSAKALIAGAGICLSVAVVLLLVLIRQPSDEMVASEFAPRTINYRVHVLNTTNQPVENSYLLVHAPIDEFGAQRCTHISASHPFERLADSNGNPVLRFPLATFAPYASKIVSIRANLMQAKSPPATSKGDSAKFATPNPDVDDANTNIHQLSSQLKSENTRATAMNMYRWISENITYTGYHAERKGAANTLSSKKGDCTEFADLFVALARAVGIPARRVSGYYAPDTNILKPMNSHDWAEFYEDGAWRIADPQQRNFDDRYSEYIATKIYAPLPASGPFDGFHRFFVHGSGLKVKMDS